MTAQKFTIHAKINNTDTILHPKTEVSQVEGLDALVTGITDSEIQSYFTNVNPSSNPPTYVTLSDMQAYVATEIAKLPLADNNDYPIADNVNY